MSDDQVINLLTDRIDAVGEAAEKTAKSLDQHVTECAKMQKYVLLGIIAILVWLVCPKAAELIAGFLA